MYNKYGEELQFQEGNKQKLAFFFQTTSILLVINIFLSSSFLPARLNVSY